MYSYTTTEDEDAHTARVGVEEETVETSWCKGCGAYVTAGSTCEHPAVLKTPPKVEPLVCSCGLTTCGAIRTYGLPRPAFQLHIEPIPSQYRRDVTALSIKRSS